MSEIHVRRVRADEWEALRDTRLRALVAWQDGEPVAIAGAFRTGGRIDVFSMWTSPAHRGPGIGRALPDVAVGFAGEAEVHLTVTETNAGARR